MQAESLIEASRTLGISRGGVFRHVALPLARPAIAVGVSLALMEALNDIGASEFLGIQTLTVSIYSTWINRSDLPGAAQISIAALALVVTLIVLERRARRHQRYTVAAQRPRTMQPLKLSGLKAVGVFVVCAIPIALGFLAPACYLVIETAKRYRFAAVSARLVQETINTLTVSALATVVVLLCGLAVVYAARLYPGKSSAFLTRVSSLGYALPGTVLAIGILFPAGIADNFIAGIWQKFFGISTGLVLLGSGAALIYAYAARFMAISTGGIEAGFHRIPPSLDFAARTLGETPAGVLRRVHLPLSKPAIAAAGLLVFVDCMKELPATLLLRPLNFETLATHLYGEAARGTYEEASIAALLIVFVGILPVALLARMGNRWAR
jgi:iron(III) transport system permease protein